MLPAVRRGKHAVTFVFNREGYSAGAHLGGRYAAGFVGPDHSEWDAFPWSNGGFGIEDDNDRGTMQLNSKSPCGNAYGHGDKVTLEVDFDADTLAIYRDKGTSTEGKHIKKGIPFTEVYFVAGPFNSDCTCHIQVGGRVSTSAPLC